MPDTSPFLSSVVEEALALLPFSFGVSDGVSGPSPQEPPLECVQRLPKRTHDRVCRYGAVFEFTNSFLSTNVPVLLRGNMDSWPALHDCVERSHIRCCRCEKEYQTQSINMKHLCSVYGQEDVCVAKCNEKCFSDQNRSTMTLVEYSQRGVMQETSKHMTSFTCKVCSDGEEADDGNQTFQDWHRLYVEEEEQAWEETLLSMDWSTLQRFVKDLTSSIDSEQNLYIKDWHLFLSESVKDPSAIYQVPREFQHDWMNDMFFCRPARDTRSDHPPSTTDSKEEKEEEDFRFVYMGPSGSWTPCHRDVYGSYSWSANVVGRKLWIMFPPHVSSYLIDLNGECVYNVLASDIDRNRFPDLEKALECSVRVIQRPGEAIFVPSGWYHQVHNLCDTMSINHNWVNGFNIDYMYRVLVEDMERVHQSLAGFDFDSMSGGAATPNHNRGPTDTTSHVDPSSHTGTSSSSTPTDTAWDEQVQMVLELNSGMNMVGFARFLIDRMHRLSQSIWEHIQRGAAGPDDHRDEQKTRGVDAMDPNMCCDQEGCRTKVWRMDLSCELLGVSKCVRLASELLRRIPEAVWKTEVCTKLPNTQRWSIVDTPPDTFPYPPFQDMITFLNNHVYNVLL